MSAQEANEAAGDVRDEFEAVPAQDRAATGYLDDYVSAREKEGVLNRTHEREGVVPLTGRHPDQREALDGKIVNLEVLPNRLREINPVVRSIIEHQAGKEEHSMAGGGRVWLRRVDVPPKSEIHPLAANGLEDGRMLGCCRDFGGVCKISQSDARSEAAG